MTCVVDILRPITLSLGLAATAIVLTGCSLIVDADECVTDRDCRRYVDEPDAMVCEESVCRPADGWACNDEGACWRTDDDGAADAGVS